MQISRFYLMVLSAVATCVWNNNDFDPTAECYREFWNDEDKDKWASCCDASPMSINCYFYAPNEPCYQYMGIGCQPDVTTEWAQCCYIEDYKSCTQLNEYLYIGYWSNNMIALWSVVTFMSLMCLCFIVWLACWASIGSKKRTPTAVIRTTQKEPDRVTYVYPTVVHHNGPHPTNTGAALPPQGSNQPPSTSDTAKYEDNVYQPHVDNQTM